MRRDSRDVFMLSMRESFDFEPPEYFKKVGPPGHLKRCLDSLVSSAAQVRGVPYNGQLFKLRAAKSVGGSAWAFLLLEDVDGFTRGGLRDVLRGFFSADVQMGNGISGVRGGYDIRSAWTAADGTEVRLSPTFDFEAHPSTDWLDILKGDGLRGAEIVYKPSAVNGVSTLLPKDKVLRLKAVRGGGWTVGEKLGDLRRLLEQHGASKVRLKFIDAGRPRSTTITAEALAEAASGFMRGGRPDDGSRERAYIRRFEVNGLDTPSTAYDVIDDFLVGAMLRQIAEPRRADDR